MAVTAHLFPSWTAACLKKQANVTTDTLQVLLVGAGTYTWNGTSEAAVTVSDFLAGSGGGALTEVSTTSTGYSRKTLATVGVSSTVSGSVGYTSITVSTNPAWTSASFTASYALFFDNTIGGTDTTNQVIAYWDFGGASTVTAATFTLQLPTTNSVAQTLVQYSAS